MLYFILLFIVFFTGLWIFITYIISKTGWAVLAGKYQYDGPFTGEKAGIISAAFNNTRYKNALVLRYNYEGMYIKPVAIFRLFHKPILIPWKEIKAIRDKKLFAITLKELVIGDPVVTVMTIKENLFSELENNIPKNLARQKRSLS